MLSHSPRNVEPEPGSNDNISLSRVFCLIQNFSECRGKISCCNNLQEKPFDAHGLGLLLIAFVAETRAEAIATGINTKN
jgi:hypothetical protein